RPGIVLGRSILYDVGEAVLVTRADHQRGAAEPEIEPRAQDSTEVEGLGIEAGLRILVELITVHRRAHALSLRPDHALRLKPERWSGKEERLDRTHDGDAEAQQNGNLDVVHLDGRFEALALAQAGTPLRVECLRLDAESVGEVERHE